VQVWCFGFELQANTVSDRALDVHCAVLQRFVYEQPPTCDGAQIDPAATRIGWRRHTDNSLHLVVELRILALSVDAGDGSQWIPANFALAEHRALANVLDIGSWLRIQDRRARQWIRSAAAGPAI